MSSEAQNTPYSIQEIKLAQWTAYFFVLEEDALVTIFQIDRACARRLWGFLQHVTLDERHTRESLSLLVELNKSTTLKHFTPLSRSRSTRPRQKRVRFPILCWQCSHRICKRGKKKPSVRAKFLAMRGSDFAAVVCSETLSHCSTSLLPEERHSRPYRWSRKHDDLLLLAHMPYDVERIKQYLEFHQLLVCSSEWLEYRRQELVENAESNNFSLYLWN